MRSLKLYDLNHNFVKQVDEYISGAMYPNPALKELRNYTGYFIWSDDGGMKRWLHNGRLHRLDGPAVERLDGENSYWINDKYIKNISSPESFKLLVNLMKLKGLL